MPEGKEAEREERRREEKGKERKGGRKKSLPKKKNQTWNLGNRVAGMGSGGRKPGWRRVFAVWASSEPRKYSSGG